MGMHCAAKAPAPAFSISLDFQSFAPAARNAINIVLKNALRWFLPSSSSGWTSSKLHFRTSL